MRRVISLSICIPLIFLASCAAKEIDSYGAESPVSTQSLSSTDTTAESISTSDSTTTTIETSSTEKLTTITKAKTTASQKTSLNMENITTCPIQRPTLNTTTIPTDTSASSPTEYDKTPMPLITYTENDEPFKTFQEVIDRTNNCKMYCVSYNAQYNEKDPATSNENKYSIWLSTDKGIGNNNKLVECNTFDISTVNFSFYRGYVLNGTYVYDKMNCQNYSEMSKEQYMQLFPTYSIQSLPIDFSMPDTSEIATKSIKENPDHVKKIDLAFELNAGYFNRGIEYYKSMIYQENPSNITFKSTSLLATVDLYGVIKSFNEITTFSYDTVSEGNTVTWDVTVTFKYDVFFASNYHKIYFPVPDKLNYLLED